MKDGRKRLKTWRWDGRLHYTLADAARLLNRSRPTLMRWLPSIERATGHAPHKSPTGRWFVPVVAVERLSKDKSAMDELARSATADRADTVASLRRDVDALQTSVGVLQKAFEALRADVKKLMSYWRGQPSGGGDSAPRPDGDGTSTSDGVPSADDDAQ